MTITNGKPLATKKKKASRRVAPKMKRAVKKRVQKTAIQIRLDELKKLEKAERQMLTKLKRRNKVVSKRLSKIRRTSKIRKKRKPAY